MCRLRNIAMRDYQESVSTGQIHRPMKGQTNAGQSDLYVPLSFAGDTIKILKFLKHLNLLYNHSNTYKCGTYTK